MRSARSLPPLLSLGAVAIALPVLAQPVSDYPLPCDASKVTKADVDRAHTVFLSGKQYLEESNYDKAISYFKDAYSIDCSVHAMLPIIATAYERKGDKTEAVRALEEYLRRAPNASDHDVIERRIRNLKDQLSREQPPTPPPSASASATVAPALAPSATPEPSVAPSPAPAPTPAASAPPPPTEGGGGHGALPWVVVGIGGVATVTGVVLLAMGEGDIQSAEKVCPSRKCPPTETAAHDQGNRGVSLANAGGGLIGAGVAIAAAGVLWHFLEKPDESAGQAPAAGARVTPAFAPGYSGVALGGRF